MISATCVPVGSCTPSPPPPPADVTLPVIRKHTMTIVSQVSSKPKRHVRFQNTCSPGSRCRSPDDDLEVVEYVTDEL